MAYPIVLALVSRRRTFGEVTTLDSSAYVQIAFTTAVFAICLHLFLQSKNLRILLFKSPLRWFILYISIAIISSLWSLDVKLTLYRGFENLSYLLLISTALFTVYKRCLSIGTLLKWILYYALFQIVVGLIKRSVYNDVALLSFQNLFLEQMGSTPFFFLSLLLPVGYLVKIIILPTSIFSLSNTAYLGMLLGSFGLVKGSKKLRNAYLIIGIVLLFIIYVIGFNVFLENTVFYGKEGIGLEYTTGRDHIALLALEEGMRKPFSGYGFVAGEVYFITQTNDVIIGAHNFLLSAFLGMGLPGVLFIALFFYRMFKISLSKNIPKKYRTAFLTSLIFICVFALGNPSIGTRVVGGWFPSTMICVLIAISSLHYNKRSYSLNKSTPFKKGTLESL